MPDVNLLAVLAATAAAFVLSSTYYTLFATELAEVSDAAASADQPPPWKLAVELLRSLTLATVVAGLASQGRIDEWTERRRVLDRNRFPGSAVRLNEQAVSEHHRAAIGAAEQQHGGGTAAIRAAGEAIPLKVDLS